MAVTCTPDALADDIACLAAQNKQTLLAEMVFLLCQLNSMECDPDTLAEDSACLSNWNEGALLGAAVKLLCDVVNGGGGGGSTNYQGVGSPEGVQTANATAIYRDTSNDAIWWKASGVGNTGWTQITGPF